MTISPITLILGPQLPIGNTYFDTTQVAMARKLGESCPAVAPQQPSGTPPKPTRQSFASDDEFRTATNAWLAIPQIRAWLDALNSYNVNLMYYDLPLSLYIVYERTGDPAFFDLFIKCADSWWEHPEYIGAGKIKNLPDNVSPQPRHAGIMGLLLRAIMGREEMWEWIVYYTREVLTAYFFRHLTDPVLHVDVREGAFALHYAVLLSQCLPDSFPLQSGGRATNGAQIRAQLLADCERIVVEYYERLQYPCGCWRYDADVQDGDGGTLVKITQPFTLGLLLLAFADLHQVTQNATVKQSLEMMILKLARHLYSDGPYRKNDPIPFDPSKRWRSFWYLWHGGTTLNPTKFEAGGWSYPGNNAGEVQDARQAIGPIIAIYGYAYKITGDKFYLDAFNELWDSAYGSTDDIKTYFATDGKGFNQHCRRAGSGLAWTGVVDPLPPQPLPIPPPTPTPTPTPTPQPLPTPPEPPKPTGPVPAVTLISPTNGATLSGRATVTATVTDAIEVYLIIDDVVRGAMTGTPREFQVDTVKLPDGNHLLYVRAWGAAGKSGDSAKITVKVLNAPVIDPSPPPPVDPPPVEPPLPPPTKPCSLTAPASIDIPRNGSRDISIRLDDLTEPTTVTVGGGDGQVSVTPTSKVASPTSAILSFRVKVKNKRMSKMLTFKCLCGETVMRVNVI